MVNFILIQVLNGVAYGLLIFLLAAGLTLIFGMMDVINPPKELAGAAQFAGNVYPSYRLFAIGVGIAIALLLWFIQQRTRVGAIIRAGVADKEMVTGLGINVNRVFSGVFVFGAALAAL